jgi:hypothetical protein
MSTVSDTNVALVCLVARTNDRLSEKVKLLAKKLLKAIEGRERGRS